MAELTSPINTRIGFARSEELVDRLKEGDEQAFEKVFDLHRDMVFGLAIRLLADKAEALDVTQEVFLTLHRKIHQFRGECSLKTWLYRVTLNQAANRNRWWKRRKKDRTISLSLDTPTGVPMELELGSDDPSPDHQLFCDEMQEALHEALGRLPFDQRSAIVLRDVQGLSYDEIGILLNIELGTVKSRIARGRERLREMLRPFYGGKL